MRPGEIKLRAPFRTVGEFPRHRAPLVPVDCRRADTSENAKKRKRYETMPRCPSGTGRISHRIDGFLVHPATSHMLDSKIKRCMSQC